MYGPPGFDSDTSGEEYSPPSSPQGGKTRPQFSFKALFSSTRKLSKRGQASVSSTTEVTEGQHSYSPPSHFRHRPPTPPVRRRVRIITEGEEDPDPPPASASKTRLHTGLAPFKDTVNHMKPSPPSGHGGTSLTDGTDMGEHTSPSNDKSPEDVAQEVLVLLRQLVAQTTPTTPTAPAQPPQLSQPLTTPRPHDLQQGIPSRVERPHSGKPQSGGPPNPNPPQEPTSFPPDQFHPTSAPPTQTHHDGREHYLNDIYYNSFSTAYPNGHPLVSPKTEQAGDRPSPSHRLNQQTQPASAPPWTNVHPPQQSSSPPPSHPHAAYQGQPPPHPWLHYGPPPHPYDPHPPPHSAHGYPANPGHPASSYPPHTAPYPSASNSPWSPLPSYWYPYPYQPYSTSPSAGACPPRANSSSPQPPMPQSSHPPPSSDSPIERQTGQSPQPTPERLGRPEGARRSSALTEEQKAIIQEKLREKMRAEARRAAESPPVTRADHSRTPGELPGQETSRPARTVEGKVSAPYGLAGSAQSISTTQDDIEALNRQIQQQEKLKLKQAREGRRAPQDDGGKAPRGKAEQTADSERHRKLGVRAESLTSKEADAKALAKASKRELQQYEMQDDDSELAYMVEERDEDRNSAPPIITEKSAPSKTHKDARNQMSARTKLDEDAKTRAMARAATATERESRQTTPDGPEKQADSPTYRNSQSQRSRTRDLDSEAIKRLDEEQKRALELKYRAKMERRAQSKGRNAAIANGEERNGGSVSGRDGIDDGGSPGREEDGHSCLDLTKSRSRSLANKDQEQEQGVAEGGSQGERRRAHDALLDERRRRDLQRRQMEKLKALKAASGEKAREGVATKDDPARLDQRPRASDEQARSVGTDEQADARRRKEEKMKAMLKAMLKAKTERKGLDPNQSESRTFGRENPSDTGLAGSSLNQAKKKMLASGSDRHSELGEQPQGLSQAVAKEDRLEDVERKKREMLHRTLAEWRVKNRDPALSPPYEGDKPDMEEAETRDAAAKRVLASTEMHQPVTRDADHLGEAVKDTAVERELKRREGLLKIAEKKERQATQAKPGNRNGGSSSQVSGEQGDQVSVGKDEGSLPAKAERRIPQQPPLPSDRAPELPSGSAEITWSQFLVSVATWIHFANDTYVSAVRKHPTTTETTTDLPTPLAHLIPLLMSSFIGSDSSNGAVKTPPGSRHLGDADEMEKHVQVVSRYLRNLWKQYEHEMARRRSPNNAKGESEITSSMWLHLLGLPDVMTPKMTSTILEAIKDWHENGFSLRKTVGVIMTIRSELAKAHRRKSLQGALSKEQDEKTSSLMSVFDKLAGFLSFADQTHLPPSPYEGQDDALPGSWPAGLSSSPDSQRKSETEATATTPLAGQPGNRTPSQVKPSGQGRVPQANEHVRAAGKGRTKHKDSMPSTAAKDPTKMAHRHRSPRQSSLLDGTRTRPDEHHGLKDKLKDMTDQVLHKGHPDPYRRPETSLPLERVQPPKPRKKTQDLEVMEEANLHLPAATEHFLQDEQDSEDAPARTVSKSSSSLAEDAPAEEAVLQLPPATEQFLQSPLTSQPDGSSRKRGSSGGSHAKPSLRVNTDRKQSEVTKGNHDWHHIAVEPDSLSPTRWDLDSSPSRYSQDDTASEGTVSSDEEARKLLAQADSGPAWAVPPDSGTEPRDEKKIMDEYKHVPGEDELREAEELVRQQHQVRLPRKVE